MGRQRRRFPIREYRSGLEDKIRSQLEEQQIEFDYEKLKLKYTIPEKEHTYTPDFQIKKNKLIIECKGLFSADDRRKMLLVTQQHPELDIRMLFQRDNYIRKNSKTKYSDWCIKNRIKFAIGLIPAEWIL